MNAEKKDFELGSEEVSIETSSIFKEDRERLAKTLRTYHIDMLAFVGVLGTGLFLSSGGTLATAGPLGALLAYIIMAVVVGCNQMAIAEVAALMPSSSATVRHLEQFIDESWGFAYGWVYVYSCIVPSEISSAALVVTYWTEKFQGVWITLIILATIITNAYSVKFYADVEYCLGLVKTALAIGLIILSVVLTCGGGPNHKAIGFKYWHEPYGPMREYITTGSLGRFAAFWEVLVGAVYAFGDIQSAPILAGEIKYPRRTVFNACKRVYFRASTILVVAIFLLTLIVPSNDKRIANSKGNASSSPFVVAIKNAGIPVLPHIINAVVLTSAFSAGNLSMVHGSRTLFALAAKNQAPKIFLRTNKRGVPYVGLILIAAFMPLAYMSLSSTSATVFSWFQSITATSLLLSWVFISCCHIALMRAMRAQGYSRDMLPHKAPFAEFAAWFSLFWSVIFLLTGGYTNFVKGRFNFADFFADYFVIPLWFGLMVFYKLWRKSKWLKPEEVDLKSLFDDVKNNPEPAEPKRTGFKLLYFFWS